MSGRLAPLPLLAAGAALLALAPSAAAQCRLCEKPTTAPADDNSGTPVRLEVETRLDFDRLVLLGPGEGTATLLPDGSRSVSGVVAGFSGRAMVGTVVVRGEAGRPVRVELPRRIELYSLSGGRVTIDSVTSDLPAPPRLDSGGILSFRFGGSLRVSGDAEGEYVGDVPITVEYL